jgi:hypothetical protein
MQLEAHGDAELEVWAGRRQISVLEHELGKPIALTKVDRESSLPGATRRPRRPARRLDG